MVALVRFFLLAYSISWVLWAPLWLPTIGIHGIPAPPLAGKLGGLGPMIAAFILTYWSKGLLGVRELASKTMWPGVGSYWMAPIALSVFCLALGYMMHPDPESFTIDRIGRFFILDLLFFGMGEEIGWRGFALPRLQQRLNALSSSVLMVIPWALWHLPLFLTEWPPTQPDLSHILGWTLSLLAGSTTLTWLFNSSRGSLLVAILFHTLYNTVSRTLENGIMGVFVLLLGIAVIMIYKPKNLALSPRITEPVNA